VPSVQGAAPLKSHLVALRLKLPKNVELLREPLQLAEPRLELVFIFFKFSCNQSTPIGFFIT
jgi:hypothetical protein